MIYADHAATTAMSPLAIEAMQPWLRDEFGNPSTLYSYARKPRKAIQYAREAIAAEIGAEPGEIYFTSGGTESDNWALTGAAFRSADHKGKIITSSIEHHAILHTCDFLKKDGYEIEYLPVDEKGIVNHDALNASLTSNTHIVSIMLANNEIGTIEPVNEYAAITHSNGSLFHTDAVQAVGHIPINVKRLDVDMLSASAHKFNGPKGIGFLYIRKGVEIDSLLHGGAQESGMRAGTENVAAIVAMSVALHDHISHMEQDTEYLNDLSASLLQHLRGRNLDFLVNGADHRIPGSLSLSFKGIEGERILHRLDLMGTMVATGSACDSFNTVLSHVIRAINVPDEYAYGTIRITLGVENTPDEMVLIAEQLDRIMQTERPKIGF